MFETPGYNEVLDTYIAYGIVESLVRAGAGELTLIPIGNKYIIETENFDGSLEKGIVGALEDMLSLHNVLSKKRITNEGEKIISDVDFSAGANVEQSTKYKAPERLEDALNKLKNGDTLSKNNKNITVPLSLMPIAGKYLLKMYGVKGNNPTKIDEFNYVLAWIGFHYYTPYINVSTNDATYVHIYAVKPIKTINLVEVLALKDLKKKISNYYIGDGKFFTHIKPALLYHIAHTESIGALEAILNKQFTVVAYTLERISNNQAVRAFGEYDISKLMDFLWYLKKENPYHAIRFVDAILRSELEISIAFIDAILYDDLGSVYNAIRGLKKKINPLVIKTIQNLFRITVN